MCGKTDLFYQFYYTKRMENIEKLQTPPIVGQTYLAPCILGKIFNIGLHLLPERLYPVTCPAHGLKFDIN